MDMGKPGAVFNRLILIAAEDVGLADPTLLVYEKECLDRFDKLSKELNIPRSKAFISQDLWEIVDQAVIAAATAYKSRLLPQASFATLYDIYQHENFSKDLSDYLDLFEVALINGDEKKALYYAYVAGIFLNSMAQILTTIERLSGIRNGDLIQKWVEEYKRNKELLMLAGSIVLLCRDLNYQHGEYQSGVSQYLPSPILPATIPDRAYDRHTAIGKRKGRGLGHFFNQGATVKNERFPNNCEQAGRNSYISADKKGLGRASKIIEAIKKNYETSKKSSKLEAIYN